MSGAGERWLRGIEQGEEDVSRVSPRGQDALSWGQGGLRVGVDLVIVEEVRRSIERFGERYLGRVYTEHERACCTGTPAVVAAGLAARFAAKEAVFKVLEPSAGAPLPSWRAVEVRRRPSGGCELLLAGEAAYLAARGGIGSLAVSLSHEGPVACAVVVALGAAPGG